MKLTEAQTNILRRGIVLDGLGGFCALTSSEYRCCERLRARRQLKLWNGQRTTRWQNQFFAITATGRAALAGE